MVEEGEDVFGGHGAGALEFALFLGVEEFAGGVEDSDGGDATIEWNAVFFGNVEIAVHLTDVDVDDDERFAESWRNFGRLESLVEDMAIEAPVATEDEKDALLGDCSGVNGVSDFFGGIGGGGIDVFRFDRLTEARGIGMSAEDDAPAIVLQAPGLGEDDVLVRRSGPRLEGESDLLDKDVDVFARVLFLDDLGREVDESFGLEGGPEGDFFGKGDVFPFGAADFGFGGGGVEGGERVRIAGKDGGAPLVEGWEGGGQGLGKRDGGEEEKPQNQNKLTHDGWMNRVARRMRADGHLRLCARQ